MFSFSISYCFYRVLGSLTHSLLYCLVLNWCLIVSFITFCFCCCVLAPGVSDSQLAIWFGLELVFDYRCLGLVLELVIIIIVWFGLELVFDYHCLVWF